MTKKTYFASDFHLGIDAKFSSKERELQIVDWLNQIKDDAEAIYLLGDVFDFWFEYKKTIPKGFTRLFGKLAEITDSGIPVFFFTGNHDMWVFDYFEKELNISTFRKPEILKINSKKFFIGHGDGLGDGDMTYKFLKMFFRNRINQWLFARLHPNFGIGVANFWSRRSRYNHNKKQDFFNRKKDWLYQFCESKAKEIDVDYIIFGHRHLPIDIMLKNGKTRYINLGDWLNFNSYAVFDGENVEILFFENPEGKISGG